MVTCALSFEELDSAALKTEVLRRSQPLLEWFLLQKHSCTETSVLATSEMEFVSVPYSLGAGFPAKMLQWCFPISKEFLLQMNLQYVTLMQLLWLLSGLYLFTENIFAF